MPTHIVGFCHRLSRYPDCTAELSGWREAAHQVSHAQDGCMVFMGVLFLCCADVWLHRLGTSFVHVRSSLELLLAKQRIFYNSEVGNISQMLLGVQWSAG